MNLSRVRRVVQLGFLLLTLVMGFQFWRYVRYFETGDVGSIPLHPNGVEAFLPIGALTSLKYWLLSGEIQPFHPAAMFIFIAAIAVSLVLKKAFCGWICPVGFLSELCYRPLKRFKRIRQNLAPPRWIDYPLRALKYLILAFFLWAIGFMMTGPSLREFLESDYWKVADVKMLHFFTQISPAALGVIFFLILLSIPIRSFWCRYLCPYGGLLGLVSWFSPFKVRRDNAKCTHCKKCTRNCPAYLPVEASRVLSSPECTSCLTCVAGCPSGALGYAPRSRPLVDMRSKPWIFAAILLLVFFGIIAGAMLTGHWESHVPLEQLKVLVPTTDQLGHPGASTSE